MYLKKMEMKGFKSFADKTIVDFKQGITCIIGPNGSGKSNITDAIRWVLGEQKVSLLRGSSMSDVIFNGTEYRKPLGMAEVSLFFDNSDNLFELEFDEVIITRRVYQSGESEYLINNTRSRLKDIRELIMDTGIGVDGYSIISQGKINSMITAKKSEIRTIFEEAAGIVKYKTRKKDAQKKLANTDSNLERIEDIVYELENRIGPLKKQKDKAEKYQQLKEELKSIEVNLLSHQLKGIYKERRRINYNLTELNITKDKNSNYLSCLKGDFKKYKNKIQETKEKISINEEQFYEINNKISSNANQINLTNERKNNSLKNIKEVKDEIQRLKKEKDIMKKKITQNNKNLTEVKEALMGLNNKIQSKEESLKDKSEAIDAIVKRNSELQNKKQRMERRVSENKNKIESKHVWSVDLKNRLKELNEENIELQSSNAESIAKRNQLNNQLDQMQEVFLKDTQKREEIKQSIDTFEAKKEQMQNQLQSLEARLTRNKTEYQMLINYEENYKGFFHSVRKLMTSIKGTSLENGVHDVVANLFKVNKKVEKAIEISLGNSMQNIVCEDRNVAKGLINHLKKNKFGRASFLPLSNLYNPSINQKIIIQAKKVDGYLGRANELIEYNSKYDCLFNYLLGRVLIVESYDDAQEVLKIYGLKYRIVTLDGEIFSPGGRITGGSYKSKSGNILSRKRQISKLKKEIKTTTQEYKKMKHDLTALRETYQKKNLQLKELEETIVGCRHEINEKESQLEYLNERLKDFDMKADKTKETIDTLENKLRTIDNEVAHLKEENKTLEVKIEQTAQEIKAEDSLNRSRKEIKGIEQEIIDFKIKRASLEEKETHFNEVIEGLKNDISEVTIRVGSKEKIISTFDSSITNLSSDLKQLANEKEMLIHTKEELDQVITGLKEKLVTFEEGMYQTEKQMEEMNSLLNMLDNKISSYNIKLAKIDVELKNINSHLWEDYKMSYLEALEYQVDFDKLANGKKEIKQIKSEIRSLGSVNLEAIEEYKSVKERYDDLSSQYEDLVKAKKSLMKVINDISKKMKHQFVEEIKKIRENFKEVFNLLFNGGKADILVEDESNILESDINVLAQPPGKKLQTLDLLSGGEKALTAISLLFAILKTKPSPFCILDEIEAALDDANVIRFAQYLENLAEESQFVVITHRKGTMASADILYGVTMEEKGISKIISLKLDEVSEEKVQ